LVTDVPSLGTVSFGLQSHRSALFQHTNGCGVDEPPLLDPPDEDEPDDDEEEDGIVVV
jgi:hypothetical protein